MEGNDGAREPLVDLNEFTSDEYNLLRFEQYLVQRSLKNQLEFCWAVQGLKSLNKDSIQTAGQFVLAIYKNYFQTGEVHVSDEIKVDVKNQIKNRNYSPEVFDEAANEVWHFLESEVYVDFLNYAENAEDLPLELGGDNLADSATATVGGNNQDDVSGGTVDVEPKDDSDPTEYATSANADIDLNSEFDDSGTSSQTFKQPWKYKPRSSSAVPKSFSTTWLEPPKESDELERNSSQRSASPSDASTAVVGLTREALKATQKIRATAKLLPPSSVCKLRPKNPYVYTNNSYNPVSRQDSEVQSFSSGCLTDNDSVIETRSKRSYRKDEGSCHNTSEFQPKPHGQIFFRGKQKEQAELYSDPKKFAEILIQKLNEVKWQREYEERNKSRHDERMTPHDLAKAIKDKLCVDEGPADDILDQHVSRVWSDTTPDSRSPPGRYRRSKVPAGAAAAIRPRVHTKEPEHLTKSRTFPTGPKYDQFDSGISVVTNSTTEDFVSSWVRDSGRLAKLNPSSNPLRNKKKEIQCFVTYQEQEQVPFCFKIPTLNVNLALFKEYMPKKGNYRYFFKCNGADGVVMEEKCKDDELVPCFEELKLLSFRRHLLDAYFEPVLLLRKNPKASPTPKRYVLAAMQMREYKPRIEDTDRAAVISDSEVSTLLCARMIGAMPSLALDRCSAKQQGSIGHLNRNKLSLHFRPPQMNAQSTSGGGGAEVDGGARTGHFARACANRRVLFQLSVLAPLCGALLLFVGLVQLIPGADGEAFSLPLIIIGSIILFVGVFLILFRLFCSYDPGQPSNSEQTEIKVEDVGSN